MNRAYSVFEIKSYDEDQRILEGFASTPGVDRIGDIVDPLGAQFRKLANGAPDVPIKWQHGKDPRVGDVGVGYLLKATPSADGINVRVQIAKSEEPGMLKDTLDYVWQSVKLRLVRGFSIGFKPLGEPERIKGGSGVRYKMWEWLELSTVTIPSNAEASILTIKSYDVGLPAATGTATQSKSPGVSGPVQILKLKPEGRMTITEQIRAFEATRQAKAARQSELMTKAGDAGETLDASQAEEYDTLEGEVAEVDKHLTRLRKQEVANKAAAVAINGNGSATASVSRAPTQVITVKPNVEKGIGFARVAMSIAACKGNRYEAAAHAERVWPDQPEVALQIKAAVAAGTTTDATWAGPLALVTPLANEFLELLRPKTLIGKIPGLRKVPFNTSVPAQSGGGTYSWVGQGAAKPISALAFATVTLPFAKAAGIIVLTKELVKLSSPSAQELVRDDMINGMQTFLDTQFIDPNVAISANVSPASVTNGVAGTAAGGVTEAFARADLRALMNLFNTNNFGLDGVVLVMSESVAFTLGTMVNAVGAQAFPGLTAAGGSLLGIPVVTSNVVGAQIVAIHAPSVLYADDGAVDIDVSEEASLQMDGAPSNPTDATTVMVSMFQRNLVALRADRFATWLKARANSVQRIHTVAYA